MHALLTAFLVALANNIDNIFARVAFSIKGIRLSMAMNLWISAITFGFSLLAGAAGGLLSRVLPPWLTPALGAGVFVALGLWFLSEPLRERRRRASTTLGVMIHQPEVADRNHNRDIDLREATVLAVALSIDSIGGSLSAGLIGVGALYVATCAATLSFVALWGGNYLARALQRLRLGQTGTYIAGGLLVLIGVLEWLLRS